MKHILFVCRGNTCRSAMAEVAARALSAGLSAEFASAGIAVTVVGAPADPRALACVAAKGLDLRSHKTRQVECQMLRTADRIYALDRGVRDRLLEFAPPEIAPRIALLTSLIPATGIDDISDPYHGTSADYADAFALIDRAVASLAIVLASGELA